MKDRVVIVTGGSSGIGKALCLVFGEAGAKVVYSGRNEDRLQAVSEELSAKGVSHFYLKGDAASEADNKRLVDETVARFGGVDILINNAGISMRALFTDLDLEVFKQVMDINFWGTVYATKYALPYIVERKGSVIGISSINGYRGTPARTAYTASKYAMNGFFEALRTEVMKKGVHVLVASPGFTNTNIRKAALNAEGSNQGESPRDEGKMMSAEEVAQHILKATRKRKRDLVLTTLGKATVLLNKLFPKWMDTMTYNHMAKEKDSPFK